MSGFDIIGPGGYGPPQLRPLEPRDLGAQEIGGAQGPLGELSIEGGDEASGGSFADKLEDALSSVSDLRNDVKSKAEALARGEPVELHELMISMGKSDVAFNMMLEVRNKLLNAWDTITRSSV